jgi:hypothetical protein
MRFKTELGENDMKKIVSFITGVMVLMVFSVMPMKAYDFAGVVVHVTTISPIQAPGAFDFTTDNTPAACNGVIYYFAGGSDEATQHANGQAVLATLLAAQLSGQSVTIYGANPTSTFQYCVLQWFGINQS